MQILSGRETRTKAKQVASLPLNKNIFMSLVMPQMQKIVTVTIGCIIACCFFCSEMSIFALRQERAGSPELPVLCCCPRQMLLGLQGPILHAWGTPKSACPMIAEAHRRNPSAEDSPGMHLVLLHPDLGHISANEKPWVPCLQRDALGTPQ